MSVLQRLADRFRAPTTIYVDKGDIIFQRGTAEVRAHPLIRFAEDGKIIELGRPAETAKGRQLVPLFAPDAENDDGVIRAFCRYHMMLISRGSLLRPRVTIVEPTFRKSFGPQAASTLHRVLRADGYQVHIASSQT
jgi:hypothetical protein